MSNEMADGLEAIERSRLSRRRFLGYAGYATIGAALAACNIGGPQSSSSATPTVGGSGLTVIPFFTTEDDPASQAVTLQAIADFEAKHSGVKITQIILSSAERDQRVLTGLQIGQDMGIFEVGSPLRGTFVDSGLLYPLDSLIASIGADQFQPGTRVVSGGHDWVYPYAIAPVGFWGRTDRISKPPTNFDEFVQALKNNTGGGKYGVAECTGIAQAFELLAFPEFMWASGADYYDPQGNVVFNSDRVTQAIQNFMTILKYTPPGNSNWSISEFVTSYTSGRVAMSVYSGRMANNIHSLAPALDPISFFAPTGGVLGSVNASVVRTSFLAVDKKTSNPELAIEFMKFLLTGDNGIKYANAVPGQLLPGPKALRAQAEQMSTPFTQSAVHRQWLKTLDEMVPLGVDVNGPMGAMATGTLKLYDGPPAPWASAAYGTNPVDYQMIQHMVADSWPVQQAQSWAVDQYKAIAKDYKDSHPNWKPYSG